MIFSEQEAVAAIRGVVDVYDRGANVFVFARKTYPAQAARDVTIAVMTRPNNFALVEALIDFGIESGNEYIFAGSQVNMASENDVDILEINVKIYYKKG